MGYIIWDNVKLYDKPVSKVKVCFGGGIPQERKLFCAVEGCSCTFTSCLVLWLHSMIFKIWSSIILGNLRNYAPNFKNSFSSRMLCCQWVTFYKWRGNLLSLFFFMQTAVQLPRMIHNLNSQQYNVKSQLPTIRDFSP